MSPQWTRKNPFKSRKPSQVGTVNPMNGYRDSLAETSTDVYPDYNAVLAAQTAVSNAAQSPPAQTHQFHGADYSSPDGTAAIPNPAIRSYHYTPDDTPSEPNKNFSPLQDDPAAAERTLGNQKGDQAAEVMLAQSLSREESSESEDQSAVSARVISPVKDRVTVGPNSNPEATLMSIVGHILEAGQSFASLQGIDKNDAEGAVMHVLRAYKDLANKRRKKRHRLTKPTEEDDLEYWRKLYKKAGREVEKLKIQKEALFEEKIKLKRDEASMQSLRETTENQIARINLQTKAKHSELEAQARSHTLYDQEQRAMWQRAVNNAQAETAAAVLRERSSLQTHYGNEIGRVRDEWIQKLDKSQRECTRLLEQSKEHHDREVEASRKEISDKDKKAQEDRVFLEQKATEEKVEILKLNETLTGALVNRPHIKGLADSALVARISSLAVKLEGISNIDWNDDLRETWPYTEDELRRLSRNTRKLKQQTVPNTLWFALNKYIFSTPFRILGEQGHRLDTDWFQSFSGC
jgi:hypothetical protein